MADNSEEFKFVEGNEDYCNSWESDRAVIVGDVPGKDCSRYVVFKADRRIQNCPNFCNADLPNISWCLCGGSKPVGSRKTLSGAKSFARGLPPFVDE